MTKVSYYCDMNQLNKLKATTEKTFRSSKVVPNDEVLSAAQCDRGRYLRLLKNKTTMTALEVIVFSNWLKCSPMELIDLDYLLCEHSSIYNEIFN